MQNMKLADLAELPAAVNIPTAARIVGISRSYAYEIVRRGEFPCRVIRISGVYRIPTMELLHLLGIADPEPPVS